jgi:Tfp pilus assembly protein FimT
MEVFITLAIVAIVTAIAVIKGFTNGASSSTNKH